MALGALVLAPVAAVAWLAERAPDDGAGRVGDRHAVWDRRGRLLRPALRGIPPGGDVGGLPGRPGYGRRAGCLDRDRGPRRAPRPLGLAGVVLLLVGIAAAAIPGATRAIVGPALLTGCAIAGYSALDRVGVRMGPAWLYAAVIWSVAAIGLVAYVAFARRDRRPAEAAATDGPARARRRPRAHAPVAGVGADDPDRAGTAGDAARSGGTTTRSNPPCRPIAGRRPPDDRDLHARPRRAADRPALGRRAAARVGDGARGGLGRRRAAGARPRRPGGSAAPSPSPRERCSSRSEAEPPAPRAARPTAAPAVGRARSRQPFGPRRVRPAGGRPRAQGWRPSGGRTRRSPRRRDRRARASTKTVPAVPSCSRQ